MNNLGRLIRKFREDVKMTREALAEGICSSKYIYLIEKGERTPSSKLTEELSAKLGVDLFEYTMFLDCEDPDFVKRSVEQMNEYRHFRKFDELNLLNQTLKVTPDFMHTPFKHEVIYNTLIYQLFVLGECELVIAEIHSQINLLGGSVPVDEKRFSLALSKYYNLLIVAFYKAGRAEEGATNCARLYKILFQVRHIKKYHEMYISITLNYIKILLENDPSDDKISILNALITFQLKSRYLDRLHLSYFLMAVILQRDDNQIASESYFVKFLYLAISLDKQGDVKDLLVAEYYNTSEVENPMITNIINML